MNSLTIFSILAPSLVTFFIGMLISTPLLKWLNANKIWKKSSIKKALDGTEANVYNTIENHDTKTPRMGGLIIWVSVLISTFIFYFLDIFSNSHIIDRLDFTSRSQTWLPLFSLLFGGVLGAVDDLSSTEFFKRKGSYIGGGMSLRYRLFFVFLISLFVSYWFIFKLDMNSIQIPFVGNIYLSPILFALVLIFMMVTTYAGSVIDGIDGLSGGVMMGVYSALGVIAMIRDKYDMAALCFAIVAGILSFLWYNIPPAKFYNSETGMTSLLLTAVVIAYLLNAAFYLLIIGGLLYITVASNIIQILSKKYRGKKVFLVAPVHHHFQAIGMPNHQVTMRYWVVSYVLAIFGIVLSLV